VKDSFFEVSTVVCIIIAMIAAVLFYGAMHEPSSPYDINQDDQINSSDSKIIYDVFLDCYVATPELITRCDVNCDGFVNDKDVSEVIEYVLTHDSSGKPYQAD